ncbi:MAG: CPBP family intramembrane metalloprotease [Sphingomonadaceae bacterium]|nr:CPBP family intramembrane metalloprotease [Sphingomonadaceae bacterium]
MADKLSVADSHEDAEDATLRALVALVIAVGGGAAVFLIVGPIADGLRITSDVGVNALGNLVWLALAVVGALALRQRLALSFTPLGMAALPAGIVAYGLAVALIAISGHTRLQPAPKLAAGPYLAATLGFILGAFAEEALFRGFLQPLLRRAWGTATGVIAAAVGFTIVHFVGGWRDPISLANIGMAGLWFGLLAVRTGGFGVPFLAHAGWNWSEALLFGASPNPGHDAAGSLLDVDLTGPAWLGGSGDGMNSALPATIVLALMIAPLLFWPPRRSGDALTPDLSRRPMPELRP